MPGGMVGWEKVVKIWKFTLMLSLSGICWGFFGIHLTKNNQIPLSASVPSP